MSDPPIFATTVRVRYEETDQMGVVYHGNYLDYFQVGRTELLRHLGFPYVEMEKKGVFLTVVGAECRYVASAGYDDVLRIETRSEVLSPLRLRFHYVVKREADETVAATGSTEHACLGEDRRPRRLPAEVRERLAVWGASG